MRIWAQIESESVSRSVIGDWNPEDCRPPGSTVHGILQTRILECIAIPFSRWASQPRDQTQSPSRGASQPRDQTQSPSVHADSLLSGSSEKSEHRLGKTKPYRPNSSILFPSQAVPKFALAASMSVSIPLFLIDCQWNSKIT